MTISSSVREAVRNRAENRCEYCRKPEGSSKFSHQVDHIIPRKHEGPSTLENLAWACFQCNIAKGSDVAVYDLETGDLTHLFNPRTQQWNDHFELDGVLIVGKTPTGRVTVLALNMKHPSQIETWMLAFGNPSPAGPLRCKIERTSETRNQ